MVRMCHVFVSLHFYGNQQSETPLAVYSFYAIRLSNALTQMYSGQIQFIHNHSQVGTVLRTSRSWLLLSPSLLSLSLVVSCYHSFIILPPTIPARNVMFSAYVQDRSAVRLLRSLSSQLFWYDHCWAACWWEITRKYQTKAVSQPVKHQHRRSHRFY